MSVENQFALWPNGSKSSFRASITSATCSWSVIAAEQGGKKNVYSWGHGLTAFHLWESLNIYLCTSPPWLKPSPNTLRLQPTNHPPPSPLAGLHPQMISPYSNPYSDFIGSTMPPCQWSQINLDKKKKSYQTLKLCVAEQELMLKQRRCRESVFACFLHITIIFRQKFYYCDTESTVFKPLVVFKLKIFFPKNEEEQ